jgi:hypothetical protein
MVDPPLSRRVAHRGAVTTIEACVVNSHDKVLVQAGDHLLPGVSAADRARASLQNRLYAFPGMLKRSSSEEAQLMYSR